MDQIDEIIATTMVNNFCVIIPQNGLDGKFDSETKYRRQYHNLIDAYTNTFCLMEQKYETVNRARYTVLNTFLTTYNHYFPETPMTMTNFINKVAEPLFTPRRFHVTKLEYKQKFFNKFMNKIMRKFHNWAIDNSVELANLRFFETKTAEINRKLRALQLRWKAAFLNYIKSERDTMYKEISFIVDQRQPFTSIPAPQPNNIIKRIMAKYKSLIAVNKQLKTENEQLKAENERLKLANAQTNTWNTEKTEETSIDPEHVRINAKSPKSTRHVTPKSVDTHYDSSTDEPCISEPNVPDINNIVEESFDEDF